MLRKEHERINRAIDTTLEVARRLERGEKMLPASLSALMQFFSFVAHRNHRDKEEELLFPTLREKGFYEGPGCIGVLLSQHHEHARQFQAMVNDSEAYENGDREAALRWAAAARPYAEGLRQHIRREEDVLLMNAERLLTDADQQTLATEFERIDARAQRAGIDEVIEDFDRLATSIGK